jgi:uncharacterized membrane protein/mono/diheme cytochrome c family protein
MIRATAIQNSRSCGLALLSLLLVAAPARESRASVPGEDAVAILRSSCIKCHGPKKSKEGLRLDTRERALEGSRNQIVLVPGNSAESRLFTILLEADSDERMPQEAEPLTAEQIGTIRTWIDAGAPWPAPRPEAPPPPPLLLLLGRLHPVAVHLPIGLLLFAVLLELRGRPGQPPEAAYRLAVGLGFASAILAASLGWLNALNQEWSSRSADFLATHRALGLLVVGLSGAWALAVWRTSAAHHLKVRRAVAGVTVLLILAAGYWGGVLVHGEDHLTGPLRRLLGG